MIPLIFVFIIPLGFFTFFLNENNNLFLAFSHQFFYLKTIIRKKWVDSFLSDDIVVGSNKRGTGIKSLWEMLRWSRIPVSILGPWGCGGGEGARQGMTDEADYRRRSGFYLGPVGGRTGQGLSGT